MSSHIRAEYPETVLAYFLDTKTFIVRDSESGICAIWKGLRYLVGINDPGDFFEGQILNVRPYPIHLEDLLLVLQPVVELVTVRCLVHQDETALQFVFNGPGKPVGQLPPTGAELDENAGFIQQTGPVQVTEEGRVLLEVLDDPWAEAGGLHLLLESLVVEVTLHEGLGDLFPLVDGLDAVDDREELVVADGADRQFRGRGFLKMNVNCCKAWRDLESSGTNLGVLDKVDAGNAVVGQGSDLGPALLEVFLKPEGVHGVLGIERAGYADATWKSGYEAPRLSLFTCSSYPWPCRWARTGRPWPSWRRGRRRRRPCGRAPRKTCVRT